MKIVLPDATYAVIDTKTGESYLIEPGPPGSNNILKLGVLSGFELMAVKTKIAAAKSGMKKP